MSHENVELVKRIYEELNSHQAFPPELFAPDCVTDLSEVSLDFRVVHGVQASQNALAPYFAAFDDFHVAAEVLHADEHRCHRHPRWRADQGQRRRDLESLFPRLDPS